MSNDIDILATTIQAVAKRLFTVGVETGLFEDDDRDRAAAHMLAETAIDAFWTFMNHSECLSLNEQEQKVNHVSQSD